MGVQWKIDTYFELSLRTQLIVVFALIRTIFMALSAKESLHFYFMFTSNINSKDNFKLECETWILVHHKCCVSF